jgi:hypothetical protein
MAPALQGSQAGAPSEVDPGIASGSTSGSVHQRPQGCNALRPCIGVDIDRADEPEPVQTRGCRHEAPSAP